MIKTNTNWNKKGYAEDCMYRMQSTVRGVLLGLPEVDKRTTEEEEFYQALKVVQKYIGELEK